MTGRLLIVICQLQQLRFREGSPHQLEADREPIDREPRWERDRGKGDVPSAVANVVLAAVFPAHDATVVERLREAGTVVLLETNMDELALCSRGSARAPRPCCAASG